MRFMGALKRITVFIVSIDERITLREIQPKTPGRGMHLRGGQEYRYKEQ
jgi:hypothetical protein